MIQLTPRERISGRIVKLIQEGNSAMCSLTWMGSWCMKLQVMGGSCMVGMAAPLLCLTTQRVVCCVKLSRNTPRAVHQLMHFRLRITMSKS